MIIKNINISSFGKIKNKEIEFKKGFNIVYGKNESGKSTIQSFIKAILYGFNVRRGKMLRNNDRIKYLPLDGIKAYGEMIVNVDDRDIIVKRSFGNTKKEDKCKILNNITGKEYTKYLRDEPGKSFFNLNTEGFQNTLFIKQLGSGVTRGKDDEIITRISNIIQSGNDKISFQKIKNNLESIKKTLVTTRKKGKLDILKDKYYNLQEEKYKKIKLNEDNMEKEKKLSKLKKYRDLLNNDIKALELSKEYVKNKILEAEYIEIKERLNKYKEVLLEKQLLDYNLERISSEVDIDWFINIKEEVKQYFNKLNISKNEEKKINSIKRNVEIQEDVVNGYDNIKKFSNDIEEKVIKLILEEEASENSYNLVRKIDNSLKSLSKKKQWLEDKLSNHKMSWSMKNEIENNFKIYESKLNEIRYIMENCKLDLNSTVKIKRVNRAIIMINSSLIIIVILFITIIYKVKFEITKAIVFIDLLLIITLTILFILRNKNIKIHDNLLRNYFKIVMIENLNSDIENIEEKLKLYTNNLGCVNYEEIISLVEEYNNMFIELEKVNKEIYEQERNHNNLNGYEVLKKIEKINEIKNKILKESNCSSLQEFLETIREFEQEKEKLDKLYKELFNEKNAQIKLNTEIYKMEINIKNKLNQLNLNFTDMKNILDSLDEIQHNFKVRIDTEQRLKAIETEYKFLLKDRNVEELRNIVTNFKKDNSIKCYESEYEIENKIRNANKELLKTEKEIKDVIHALESSNLMSRNLSVIEEDIVMTKLEIDKYEKQIKSIDITLRILEESFQIIQNSVGPILNKKVGEIFSYLTNGEYSEVKVSDNYDIVVKGRKENSLINLSYLSNGTWDQIYLALRLAIIDVIFNDETVPIILDESFSQYDEERLKNALYTLVKLSDNKQIILFTCQKREVDLMLNNNNINIITL